MSNQGSTLAKRRRSYLAVCCTRCNRSINPTIQRSRSPDERPMRSGAACSANVSRRALVGSAALIPFNLCKPAAEAAAAAQQQQQQKSLPPHQLQPEGLPPSSKCYQQLSAFQPGACYTQQGPLLPLELPRLEHTCASCFPACVGDKCLVSISVTYPKGGSRLGVLPPYPLAIFCGGFTVSSQSYSSTAARLASWGWTVVRFDTRDALPLDILDDATCVALLRELINWSGSHPLMRRLADPSRVYLAGHSRGGKLAALAAAADPRVAALCLVDPVDVTRYAPLSDRFPSAAAALQSLAQTGRFLPVAVVGSGLAGDCAPPTSNYQRFFQAAPSVAWQLFVPAAGHFSYLDSTTPLQRAVCGADAPDDAAVRGIAQAALVAWGETFVKPPGTDLISCLAARCGSLAAAEAAAAGFTAAARAADTAAGRNTSSLWQQPPWASSSSSSSAWQPPPEGVPLSVLKADRSAQAAAAAAAAAAGSNSSAVAAAVAAGPSATSGNSQTPSALAESGSDSLSALPRVATRQEVWAASCAPSPSQLRLLQSSLERLLVAVSYQRGSLEVQARYKNFG